MAVPRYLRSWDLAELLLCVAFAFRPLGVPHQYIEGEVLFDLTFDRTAGEETVSTALLVVLGIVLPLVAQCVLSGLQIWMEGRQQRKEDGGDADDDRPVEDNEGVGGVDDGADQKRQSDSSFNATMSEERGRYYFLHTTLCTYATTLGTTLLFTESAKRYVGYMRPNFYQLCQPEAAVNINGSDALICNEEASGDTDVERYQSFPSGHASVAYAGLTLLSLFLGRVFGFPCRQTNGTSSRRRLWRLSYFVSVLLVQSLAVWIATSRLADLVHHPADVLAGAVLGAGCAIFVDGMW